MPSKRSDVRDAVVAQCEQKYDDKSLCESLVDYYISVCGESDTCDKIKNFSISNKDQIYGNCIAALQDEEVCSKIERYFKNKCGDDDSCYANEDKNQRRRRFF